MKTRASGILLHITSLPGRYGIGDLGPAAYRFVDFLSASGMRYWQVLPIHPTDSKYDNSPYHGISACAGNPLLISPELLVIDGYLDSSDIEPVIDFPLDTVDFPAVIAYKERLFDMAYHRFVYFGSDPRFGEFCKQEAWWLDDYALFSAIRKQYPDHTWSDLPEEIREKEPSALAIFRKNYADIIEREQFLQYIFSIQWKSFRKKCHDCGIRLIGDIPIYMDYDSVDVWIHPEMFLLDEMKRPKYVAGVPPDYFSATGQVWNNPLYDWNVMKMTNFAWWVARMRRELYHHDYVRIDHFRGLVGFWEIQAGSDTAIDGRWVQAPGWDLVQTLAQAFPCLPIIAEDLGIITPEVRELMRAFAIPGMKVLVFAFSSPTGDNPYILHNIPPDSVVYTGTHDNPPVRGWFENDATDEEKNRIFAYLGRVVQSDEIADIFVRLAMMSNAQTAIIPMQDILGLDSSARMNTPGTKHMNWRWRVTEEAISHALSRRLKEYAKIYGR